ncbi:enoyl-ACP reductase [Geomonas sp. Red69]|uniref:Enoyl-[acyl-carrier-protein] reductase [NADH] n=1 Tax=Geomonas diazotrophica TaxID=2843197 RepID=A0ABX8JKJ1_9BACT|nr:MULTISPECIES: enoyl-ACP reductase [Geomonas]MBU5636921.1 enoyl-ACP reductase [Geomonas diazotrophica]QWV98823.1 enoyl-ACP reductase [Geomonas nitrogeniifigens]QXE87970.1 enoyl-ACP reductase [Geomonas nitrogeniifigens]
MGLLEGKKALIFGVANDKSIAWATAEAFHREGAEVALAYAGEAVAKRVMPLAESIGSKLVLPCDVRSDEEIARLFDQVREAWGGLDILVHSVAFANKDELKGSFLNTTREGFATALDISAYSLIAMAREAAPLMQGRDGSVIAMTYYGAQKVFPNYNVMGVAKAALEASVRYLAEAMGPEGTRVNAISAGPLRTLASAGIGGFGQIAGHVAEKAPLRRNISQEEVGNAALYLASPLASGVTGEIHFVDCGYNIIGL